MTGEQSTTDSDGTDECECRRCGGIGMVTVELGRMAGSVKCPVCNGDGTMSLATDGGSETGEADENGPCEYCGTVHHTTDEHEMVEVEAPAYFVDMPAGMPDLLLDDFDAAYQNATGDHIENHTDFEHDEHPDESRIHLVDSDGVMEVPVVDL